MKNMIRKILMIAYVILVLLMCIFIVPHKINATKVSSQNVPHSIVIKTEYHPIWYSRNEESESGNTLYTTAIDYSRLALQLFCTSIVLGVAFYLSPKK